MLKHGFYNTIAGLIRIGIGIFTIPVLIRSLGVEEYGLFTLASTVISIVTLAEAGLSNTTTVFLSQDLAKDDLEGVSQTLTVTSGAIFLLATLGAIGMVISADLIVSSFSKLESSQHSIVVQSLRVGGIVIWTRLIQQVLMGIEQAFQSYFFMNLLNTVQSISVGLGMLLIVWSGGRTFELIKWQAVVATIVLIAHLILVFSLLRFIKPNLLWNKDKNSTILLYSIQAWLTSLGGVLFTQVDKLIVGSILGVRELGMYAAITNIAYQINVISALPTQPIVPIVSNYFSSQNLHNGSLKKQIKSALQLNTVVAFGVGMVLFSFTPLLLNLLVVAKGESVNLAAPFRIAIIIYALYSINSLGYHILFSVHKITECMKIQLLSGVFSLVLIYLGTKMFGLIGAIGGNVGYLGVCYLTIFAMRSVDNLWLRWLRFPICWFSIAIILNLFIDNRFPVYILFLLAQLAIIARWYLKNNSLKTSSVTV
jgi:O-antigen/teichoic acid export membrane protein